MGVLPGYAGVGSRDMSWLPLPRFGSRAVGVAGRGLGARDGGAASNIRWEWAGRASARQWVDVPPGYAGVGSLDMSWLPLPRFGSRAVGVAVCVWVGVRRKEAVMA
jgi:hypothetical protein